MTGVAGVTGRAGRLGVDADDLAACVACGLCLPYCPTYRVSGEEGLSPRGRIAAMRAVDEAAPADATFARLMQTCVQCRACESACPSAVKFGRLMEGARVLLAPRTVPWWQRAAYRTLGSRRALGALTAAGAAAQRLRLIPGPLARRLSLPRLPLRQGPLRATGDDVWLFTGCVMDAWQRDIHRAAIAVLGACGAGVALPGPGATCCGALHVHAGLHDDAIRLAHRVMAAFPGSAPILVDSAGCGAALKDYGHLVGTDEAQAFAARVLDIHEWLAAHADRLPAPRPGGPRPAHRRAGSLPSPPRPAPRGVRPGGAGAVRRPAGTGRRRPLLWGGRGVQRPGARSSPAASGPRRWPSSPRRPPTWWPAPTRAAACGWPRQAFRCAIRWRSSPPGRGCRLAMAGEFGDIRRRLEAISEELADLALVRLRESIDAGGRELPVDERRLTRARRAVEKAAAILAEPDDHDQD